jgi:hypothetical protein
MMRISWTIARGSSALSDCIDLCAANASSPEPAVTTRIEAWAHLA